MRAGGPLSRTKSLLEIYTLDVYCELLSEVLNSTIYPEYKKSIFTMNLTLLVQANLQFNPPNNVYVTHFNGITVSCPLTLTQDGLATLLNMYRHHKYWSVDEASSSQSNYWSLSSIFNKFSSLIGHNTTVSDNDDHSPSIGGNYDFQ